MTTKIKVTERNNLFIRPIWIIPDKCYKKNGYFGDKQFPFSF